MDESIQTRISVNYSVVLEEISKGTIKCLEQCLNNLSSLAMEIQEIINFSIKSIKLKIFEKAYNFPQGLTLSFNVSTSSFDQHKKLKTIVSRDCDS